MIRGPRFVSGSQFPDSRFGNAKSKGVSGEPLSRSLPVRTEVEALPSRPSSRTPMFLNVEPDRRLLIVDSPGGALQQLALDLLSRDFEVHYAADIDEAQLLAGETDGQINAVLFTAAADIERIPDLAARFRVSPEALIPCGDRPPDRVVKALHHHGVRWQLWDDPQDESVRFVISGVLHAHDPFELRYHLRVPTRLAANYTWQGGKTAVVARDIGLGGACLIGGAIGETGDEGELHLSADGREVGLPTRVAWAAPDTNDALCVGGVSFLEVDPEAGELLDQIRRDVIAAHRIGLD